MVIFAELRERFRNWIKFPDPLESSRKIILNCYRTTLRKSKVPAPLPATDKRARSHPKSTCRRLPPVRFDDGLDRHLYDSAGMQIDLNALADSVILPRMV